MTVFIKTTVETFCDNDTFVSYCELVEAQEQPADEFVGCGDYMKDVIYQDFEFIKAQSLESWKDEDSVSFPDPCEAVE